MKKIRVILSVFAFTLASVGVFANKLFSTVYYRSSVVSSFGTRFHPRCDVVVTPIIPCTDTGGHCARYFIHEIDGIEYTNLFYVSKKVGGGACEIVPGFD